MIGRTQLAVVEHDEEFIEQSGEQNLQDLAEIRRVVDEIDNTLDEKDWARCRSYFAGEVETDFTSLEGGEPAKIPADDMIEAWRTNLFAEKKTFHQRGNHRIKLRGERAEVFSKVYAFNLIESGEAAGFWEVWGNYTHSLIKTDAGWKCAAIRFEVIHQRGDRSVRTAAPEK